MDEFKMWNDCYGFMLDLEGKSDELDEDGRARIILQIGIHFAARALGGSIGEFDHLTAMYKIRSDIDEVLADEVFETLNGHVRQSDFRGRAKKTAAFVSRYFDVPDSVARDLITSLHLLNLEHDDYPSPGSDEAEGEVTVRDLLGGDETPM